MQMNIYDVSLDTQEAAVERWINPNGPHLGENNMAKSVYVVCVHLLTISPGVLILPNAICKHNIFI